MRKGYTLAELLVVAVIVVILIAAALPVARKVMEDSRTREATRILQSTFTRARTMAALEQRPHGVWLEAELPVGMVDPATVTASTPIVRQVTKVYLAETPPMYAGGTVGARAIIRTESGVEKFVPLVPVVYIDANNDGQLDNDANGDGVPDPSDLNNDGRVDQDTAELALINSLVGVGEFFAVRFDNKGEWYYCRRTATDLLWLHTNSSEHDIHPPGFDVASHNGESFQIKRQPRRIGSPAELPGGTAIDLTYSGTGLAGRQLNTFPGTGNHVVIMLSPNGDMTNLIQDGQAVRPMETLHLLIGKPEKMAEPLGANANHASALNMFDPATSNLADFNSFWVSIGRNGSVIASENIPDLTLTDYTAAGQLNFVAQCRAGSSRREAMGGK